jgi:hypothetical protein
LVRIPSTYRAAVGRANFDGAIAVNSGVTAVVPVDGLSRMDDTADLRAFEALSQHPRLAVLVAVARATLAETTEARRPERRPEQVAELAAEQKLDRAEAATPFGNALDVLQRGPEDDAERALAHALAAHVVAHNPPKDRDDEDRIASDLVWLAAHTPFDATNLLDRALGEAAANLWDSLADRIRRIDEGKLPALGRGEALVAAAALAASASKGARRQAAALAADVRDPKIARVLGAGAGSEPSAPVTGEMVAAPRGTVVTVILAMTGLLFVVQGGRLLARLALAYRKPAVMTLVDEGGVRVRWRVELLGRTLRDRDVFVPRTGLTRATREVRYPGAAVYAGLLALALGSYVGVEAFVDGVRAASPSLLAAGLGIVVLGIALDFALSSLGPGSRGRCRLLLVPRDGRQLCVGGVDASGADAMLSRLARR